MQVIMYASGWCRLIQGFLARKLLVNASKLPARAWHLPRSAFQVRCQRRRARRCLPHFLFPVGLTGLSSTLFTPPRSKCGISCATEWLPSGSRGSSSASAPRSLHRRLSWWDLKCKRFRVSCLWSGWEGRSFILRIYSASIWPMR